MSFFAPVASTLWKQIDAYEMDPAALFAEAGIDPEAIFDPGARIPFDAVDHLLDRLVELTGDPLLGLKGVAYFRPAHLGALGFAWLASSSLQTAFERLSRYAAMINEKLSIDLSEEDGFRVITFDAHQPSRVESMREDMQLAVATKSCRAIAGDRFSPHKVQFKQVEPADTQLHYEWFRCPLEFHSSRTAMYIPLELANARLAGSNDELAKLNEHIVVKYLAHSAKNDIVNRVKASIIDGLASGGLTESVVAAKLHMTCRNLHRKLGRENTSFKVLLNEVRKELAQQYIKDRSITLTEISFMLGFSEVSSFSRAFKNWTGKPPSAMRQAGVKSAV